MVNSYNFTKTEKKWQRKWDQARVFEANVKKGQKKFFTSIVIPYPSGDLHIGHARTFTRTDIIARFKKMQGYNVLNPMGFHATGNRVPILAKRLKEKDKQTINILKDLYNCKQSDIDKITDPKKLVKFFVKRAIQTIKMGGLAIDWRRVFLSIDKEFSQFITWQFEMLRRKGYVVKGSHPVIYCPSCESPITQSDRAEGEEAIIQEYAVAKCKVDNSDLILPAATLRPETTFAWTNMFLNPNEDYVIADVDGEKWVLGKKVAEKIGQQRNSFLIIDDIVPEELIGRTFTNPMTEEKGLLILPGNFVDTSVGTGVVVSEPSDAPDDHIALEDLKKNERYLARFNLKKSDIEKIKYVPLIDLPGYGKFPAVDICERMGIKSGGDEEKLLAAKKEMYKLQFHRGTIVKSIKELAGKTIPEAIEFVKHTHKSVLDSLHEPSEKVVCKCGANCHIKILKDQWFLKYGDKKWKARVKKHIDTKVKILPNAWRARFDAALDWTQNKACARRAGLGTPLPWDKTWVIETLSDSTIYMSYYMISKYINENKLKTSNLTHSFFDFVLLGKGDIKKVASETKLTLSLLKQIRSDFEYWYPMDWRNSGKDLVSNHLLYFLYNHVAIFPKRLWPKIITVNGFVNIHGEKMSKSKGRAVTFKTGIAEYGADVVRTVTATTASPEQDSDFREDEAKNMTRWVQKFYSTIIEVSNAKSSSKNSNLDKWLQSRITQAIKITTENLEVLNSRDAAQACIYQITSDFRWYLRRSAGKISKVTKKVASDWVKMVSVFMPHLAEELWQKLGNKGFVSTSSWPKFDKKKINEVAEKAEGTIQNAAKDIHHITRITNKKPKQIFIYVIPPELKIYKEAGSFLEKEFGAKVQFFASNDKTKYDPENKAKKAKPGRPGIYIE